MNKTIRIILFIFYLIARIVRTFHQDKFLGALVYMNQKIEDEENNKNHKIMIFVLVYKDQNTEF